MQRLFRALPLLLLLLLTGRLGCTLGGGCGLNGADGVQHNVSRAFDDLPHQLVHPLLDGSIEEIIGRPNRGAQAQYHFPYIVAQLA